MLFNFSCMYFFISHPVRHLTSLFRPNGILLEIEHVPEHNHLKDGDIVTINYDNITPNAVPVNPKISRIRKDVSWTEVKRNHSAQFNGTTPVQLIFQYISFFVILSVSFFLIFV